MHHIDRIEKLGDQGGTDSIERVGLDERHSMVEHVSERLDELAVLEFHLFDPGYDDMIGRDLFADWRGRNGGIIRRKILRFGASVCRSV